MKRQEVKSAVKLAVSALALSSVMATGLMGCAEEPAAKTVNVALEFGGYGGTASLMDLIIPKAFAAASGIEMCIGRLRLKPMDDTEAQIDNVDFNLGLVTLDAAGTFLGEIEIPAMEYRRIEFDLEPDCVGGNSVSFSDGAQTHTAQDTITVRFEGSFVADANGTLVLGVGHIITALDGYDGSSSIKVTLENVSGDL